MNGSIRTHFTVRSHKVRLLGRSILGDRRVKLLIIENEPVIFSPGGLPRHQEQGWLRLLKEDVASIGAMRKHLGDGFPLMVDANMKWTVDEAVRRARALREFELILARGAGDPRRRGGTRTYRARWRRPNRDR